MATETPSFSLRDLPGVVRRRRRLVILLFAGIVVITLAVALFWPPTYRSTGTILIEQQEVPAELVRSTISSYADQRIQVIKQQVMTTENLYRIIQKYDLYAKERRTKGREVIMKKMTDDISFKMISADVIDPRSGNPTKATIAFTVGYDHESPDIAARVANELASLYLERNLESRKQRTADAADFLSDESKHLNARIEELQGQIATFKQEHTNAMPEQAQVNQALLTRTEEELRDSETRMRSLDQQVVYLDAQLAQIHPSSQVYTSTGERVLSPTDRLKFLRTEYARLSGVYAADHPDVLRIKREMEGLEKTTGGTVDTNDLQRQLDDTSTQLAAAQEKYSADHPDIARLQRLKAALEGRLQKARGAASAVKPATPEPDNPAYIQIAAEREAAVNERSSLAHKNGVLRTQIGEIEKHMADAPAVERDYSVMVRELESDQLQYRQIRQKQMEAQSSQNLESERKGERFTLIEPPLTPTEPDSPNRVLIIVVGLALALAIPMGAAALLESNDSTVRDRRDLTALLSVPPLAVLPWIETFDDRQAYVRARRLTYAGAVTTLFIAVALVHFLYRPLDVLWEMALRRVTG